MKNLTTLLISISFLILSCQSSETQTGREDDQIVINSIQWKGANETANHMALEGLNRYITYENTHAFVMSEEAVKLDSSLFASHVILAFLSEGARKEYHKQEAKKYVRDGNEVSKLFVSLLDYNETNDSLRDQRKAIWTKMHQLTPDPFIHYMYIRHMDGSESEVLAELEKLILFCKNRNFNYAGTAANNMKGYMLNRAGNLEKGTEAIEQCLILHPDGYNPLDSRAEFYLYAGDTSAAIKSYKKVLEKYPFAEYARSQLAKLESQKNN